MSTYGNNLFTFCRRNLSCFSKVFKDSFESPFIEVSYLIKKALSENKITTGSNAANIVWAGTNGFITQKIGNKSTHDCLLDLAMGNTPEGQAFKSQLSSLTS